MGCVFRAQSTYGMDDSNLGKRKREASDEGRDTAGTSKQLADTDSNGQTLDAGNGPSPEPASEDNHASSVPTSPTALPPLNPLATSPLPDPSSLLARQSRLSAMAAESAERYKSRTRRRRTRPFAGIPADPPGPPRFPSETTLEEAKIILSLDNQTYSQLRQLFAQICHEEGIRKKTEAGNQKWSEIKGMLVSSSQHLTNLFTITSIPHSLYQQPETMNSADMKKLHVALDVLCSDVTKRLRTPATKLPLASARNILHLNPNAARQLCGDLRTILLRDGFTSKIEAGEQHWEELKREWIQGSDLLTEVVREDGEKGKKESARVLAMETLARDVMKRLRDEQTGRLARNRARAAANDAGELDRGDLEAQPAEQQDRIDTEDLGAAADAMRQLRSESAMISTAPMLPMTVPRNAHAHSPEKNATSSTIATPAARPNPRKIHHSPGGRQMAYLARKKQKQQSQQEERQQKQQRQRRQGDDDHHPEARQDAEPQTTLHPRGKEGKEAEQGSREEEEFANMQIDPLLMLAAANNAMAAAAAAAAVAVNDTGQMAEKEK